MGGIRLSVLYGWRGPPAAWGFGTTRSRAACRAWLAGGAEDCRRRGSPQVTSAARRRPIRQVLLYLGAPDSPLPASPLPGGSAVRSPSRAAGRPRAGPPQEVLGRRRTEGHRRVAQPAHVAKLPRPRTPGRGPPRHGPVCPLQDPRCPRSEERSLDQELGPWGLSPTPQLVRPKAAGGHLPWSPHGAFLKRTCAQSLCAPTPAPPLPGRQGRPRPLLPNNMGTSISAGSAPRTDSAVCPPLQGSWAAAPPPAPCPGDPDREGDRDKEHSWLRPSGAPSPAAAASPTHWGRAETSMRVEQLIPHRNPRAVSPGRVGLSGAQAGPRVRGNPAPPPFFLKAT